MWDKPVVIKKLRRSRDILFISKRPHCNDPKGNVIKERINDTFKQQCYNRIMTNPKGSLYKHLVNEFKLQNYLRKPLDVRCLKEITKIRIYAHKLNLEFGRHRNVERSERKCKLCNLTEIEDEYHFILQCPLYNDIRMKFIKTYYHKRPSVLKLTQLLTSQNNKELSNLGYYLLKANAFRDQLLEQNG